MAKIAATGAELLERGAIARETPVEKLSPSWLGFFANVEVT